jgi:hypothetical protein
MDTSAIARNLAVLAGTWADMSSCSVLKNAVAEMIFDESWVQHPVDSSPPS